jgi:hypothetical protein
MDFTIMVWRSRDVRASSIFCVFDKIKPGILPPISKKGHWVHHGTIGESRYKDAEAAKKSIAEFGYYLTGGEQAFTTAQGRSSSRQTRCCFGATPLVAKLPRSSAPADGCRHLARAKGDKRG